MANSYRYIIVYDVKGPTPEDAASRRKALHWRMKKWLHPIQRSVFEGALTKSQLGKVLDAALKVIDQQRDTVTEQKT